MSSIDVRNAGGQYTVIGGALAVPTSAYTVTNPTEGGIRYNLTTKLLELFVGGIWTAVTSSTGIFDGSAYLPLAGGTMTGLVTLAGDPIGPLDAMTKQYADNHYAASVAGGGAYLPVSGGTVTGNVTIQGTGGVVPSLTVKQTSINQPAVLFDFGTGTAPVIPPNSNGVVQLAGPDSTNSPVVFLIDSFATAQQANFTGRKRRGTRAAPTAVGAGDIIVDLYGLAYDGTSFWPAGEMRSKAVNGFGSTDRSTVWETVANNVVTSPAVVHQQYGSGRAVWGSVLPTTEFMRLESSGNLLLGTATDAGYRLDVNATTINARFQVTGTATGNTALLLTGTGYTTGPALLSSSVVQIIPQPSGGNGRMEMVTSVGTGFLTFRRSEGTASAPSASGSASVSSPIGAVQAMGYTPTSGWTTGARASISFQIPVGIWTETSTPTLISFTTTNVNAIVSAEAMRIQPSGNLSIGTTIDSGAKVTVQGSGTTNAGMLVDFGTGGVLPALPGNVGVGLQVASADVGSSPLRILVDSFGNTVSRFTTRHTSGTRAAPTTIVLDAIVGSHDNFAYDGSAYGNTGELRNRAAVNFTTSDHSSYWEISATNLLVSNSVIRLYGTGLTTWGSNLPTAESMRLQPSGNLSIGYGVAPADSGYKLDVSGRGRFTGTVTAADPVGASDLLTVQYGDGRYLPIGTSGGPGTGPVTITGTVSLIPLVVNAATTNLSGATFDFNPSGGTPPVIPPNSNGVVQIAGPDSGNSPVTFLIDTFATAQQANFTGRKRRGSRGLPTAVGAGDIIVDLYGLAYDGTSFWPAGEMRLKSLNAFGADRSTYWETVANTLAVSPSVVHQQYGSGLAIWGSALPTTEFMRLQPSGNLSIGYGAAPADSGYKLDVNATVGGARFSVTSGTTALHINANAVMPILNFFGPVQPAFEISGKDATRVAQSITSYGGGASGGGFLQFLHAGGTGAAPTVTEAHAILGQITAAGYTDAFVPLQVSSAAIAFINPSASAWSDGANNAPAAITFSTTNTGDGSQALTEAMRVSSNGNLLVGTTTDSTYKLDVTGNAQVTGSVTVNGAFVTVNAPTAQWGFLSVSCDSGQKAMLLGMTKGSGRWAVDLGDATPEGGGGSNTGSHFAIERYNDGGTYVDSPLYINRTTGNLSIASTVDAGSKFNVFGTARIETGTGAFPTGSPTAQFILSSLDATQPNQALIGFGNGSTPNIQFWRSNGTRAAPTALAGAANMGNITWYGYGATGFSSSARASIAGVTSELWTDTAQGASITFNATPLGTTATATLVRLWGSGNLMVGGTLVDTGFRLDVGGTARVTGAMTLGGTVGFNGSTPFAKPTITGSRGTATVAVLTALLSALNSYGLITDSTTA